jgi:fido (protein-threonine AMPylation protein)
MEGRTFEDQACQRYIDGELTSEELDRAFDTLISAIHHQIFQDVYPWAEFRTVDIAKGDTFFGLKQHIVPFLDRTFAELKRAPFASGPQGFASRGAHYLRDQRPVRSEHPAAEK